MAQISKKVQKAVGALLAYRSLHESVYAEYEYYKHAAFIDACEHVTLYKARQSIKCATWANEERAKCVALGVISE